MSGWDMPTQHLCHPDHILGALWGKLIHSWENCHTNGPDTAPGCCHLNHHTLLSTWTTLYPWSCKANLTQCAKLAFINRPRGPCLSANKWVLINNPTTCTALSQQTSALRLSQWLPAWQKHQQPPKNWMKGKTSKRKGWGTVSFTRHGIWYRPSLRQHTKRFWIPPCALCCKTSTLLLWGSQILSQLRITHLEAGLSEQWLALELGRSGSG